MFFQCSFAGAWQSSCLCRSPKNFAPSAKKILQKAAELIQRTGGRALAMYVDNQHSCSFYASKELAALATDTTATNFFCQELVQKPHERLGPHEFLLSRFTPATLKEQQLQFMSDSKSRQKTWRERAGNLQALAKLTAQTHPDNAFLLFLEGGKDGDIIQEAPAKGDLVASLRILHGLSMCCSAFTQQTHQPPTATALVFKSTACQASLSLQENT